MGTSCISDCCQEFGAFGAGAIAGGYLGLLAVEEAATRFPNYLGRVIKEYDVREFAAIGSAMLGAAMALAYVWRGRAVQTREVMGGDTHATSALDAFMWPVYWCIRHPILVLKILIAAGLIYAGGILGGPDMAVLVASAIYMYGLYQLCLFVTPPEDKLKYVFASTSKANQVISFPYKGKEYKIRSIHNPTRVPIRIRPFSIFSRCIIAPAPGTPQKLIEKVCAWIPPHAKAGGLSVLAVRIKNKSAYDLLASK